MKQCFPSRSQAIHLSSDDEDEYGTSPSVPYNCINNCLPQFNMGFIRLPSEDATLDDYLNPNTATTIEPLLEEYNQEQQHQFGNATLKEPKKFLSRNPFASSTSTFSTPNNNKNNNNTPLDNNSTITVNTNNQSDNNSSYTNNHGSYLPKLDFFMDQDDGDAEFLSDHRISAVIGDTSKLTNQFKLFEAEEMNKDIQDRELSLLDHDNHHRRHSLASISSLNHQPFEIDNQLPNDMVQHFNPIDNDNDDVEEESESLLDIQHKLPLPLNDSIEVFEEQNVLESNLTSSKEQQYLEQEETSTEIIINNNQNENNECESNVENGKSDHATTILETELVESPSDYHHQQQQKSEINNTQIVSYVINDTDENSNDHANNDDNDINITKELNTINRNNDNDGNNNNHIDNDNDDADTHDKLAEEKEKETKQGTDKLKEMATMELLDQMDNTTTTITELSYTPIPTPPTSSSTNAISPFPSTGLPRTPYRPSNQQSSIIYPAMESPSITATTPTTIPPPINKTRVISHQQPLENMEPSSKLNINNNINNENTNVKNNNNDNTLHTYNNNNNNNTSSDEPLKLFNGNGIRRPSVASMAQSLLGDKLEDFTEKLAYIKKNIIMSLDDTDDDGDDNNNNYHSPRHNDQSQQRTRRQRSGSVNDPRKQAFDPFVSRFTGKQKTNNTETTTKSTSLSPSSSSNSSHRRSNSLMDVAPSLAKFVNQIGGGNNDTYNNNNNNDEQQHHPFSPSSFFSSLAGPDPTLQRKSSSNQLSAHTSNSSLLPERSSSMQPHHIPTSSSSTSSLAKSKSSNLFSSSPSSSLYSNQSRSATSLNHHERIKEEDEEDNEEDLFDFSKVIALSKNVKNFSEDVMGNGIRLFNDFSTRVKNANKLQQQHLQQLQQQRSLQPSSSSLPSQQQQVNDNSSSMDQEFLLGDTFI